MEGPSESAPGSSAPPKEFAEPKIDEAAQLAAATVGLVSREEFARRREAIEAEAAASAQEKGEKKAKKKKKKGKATLSFGDDLDEEEGGADEEQEVKRPKLGKNPNVDTSFIPDKERDEALQRQRDELAAEYKQQQDAIKAEEIEVTYSYWDGKGRRLTTTVPKGFTIQQFLVRARTLVAPPHSPCYAICASRS